MHIAMWSGPRNLSTAMMYSFASRRDCEVIDEPFYGAFLALTGDDHPMRDAVLASMDCDPVRVAERMKALGGADLTYTKQMTHHMVDAIPRDWFNTARHVFLIRHPARVVASYAAKRAALTLDDIGFAQQVEIFEQVRALGQDPVVVDSFDVRQDPERTLRALCGAVGIDWDPGMLSWPKGGHPADGVWAAHWYGAVHGSTGFAAPEGELPELEPHLQKLADAAMPHYEAMAARKL